jgi:hypothetical protein
MALWDMRGGGLILGIIDSILRSSDFTWMYDHSFHVTFLA